MKKINEKFPLPPLGKGGLKKDKKECSSSPLGKGIIGEFGFSLIELIIVISIIAIISVFGMSSFSDQIDSLKFKNILGEISGDLKDLDNKIHSKQIFDYEVIFFKNQKYYLVNENIFDLENKLELNGITSGIGNLVISGGDSSASGSVKIYSGYKFIKENIKNGDESFTGQILSNKNYKFEGTYSGSILNNLFVNFFNREGYIKLIKIDTNVGAYMNLDKIKIINILGKKEFGDSNTINKIVLTFEDDLGKSEVLEIMK